MALTELTIKNLKPKSTSYVVTDSSGLGIEISPSGGKLWRWRYYYQGKRQLMALGKYPTVTLAEARKKRDEGRALLEAGKHPSREKKAAKLRLANESENTFKHVALKWYATKEDAWSSKSQKNNLARLTQHIFPSIGNLPITEITIPDVVQVMEKIGNRGNIEMANRVKLLMKQVFRYATQRGLCKFNPAADLQGILPSQRERHFSCVPMHEVPKLLRDIEGYQSEKAKIAMQLLALTFVRTGELIAAQWDEIDWDKSKWHIPEERMKMKRPHIVPLSRQALKLLRELQKHSGNHKYIFYSAASRDKHISNGAVLMALRRMGYCGKMTGHGFRTMASTILNEQGYSPDVIERQLAHGEKDKIRDAYNRAEYLPERKKMMQEYADHLDMLKNQKSQENSIPIKRRRKNLAA